ncbi:MAG: inorganic phosphate transporter [Verrucomicrobiae bacterium]|nr:inorganic phosphate transporter [Verrucomicrobiae bacterium]
MDPIFWLTLATVALLLFFDYTNGFHDTANMVGSVIATRAMSPTQAIAIVSFFTFLGPLLGGTAVANTLGQFFSLDDRTAHTSVSVVFVGVIAAVAWNLFTWWRGIPSSSSHALVGGLIGAVLAEAGADHIHWGWDVLVHRGEWTGVTKIVAALLLSPVLGLIAGFLLMHLLKWLCRGATPKVNRPLRRLQWLGVAWLAFSHGANDGQKSMGVITMVLVLGGHLSHFQVPYWVMLLCAAAITLGTASGGWRIVRTVGFGIYRLRPIHGFASQLAAASVISGAASLGAPVSTTHLVSSTIMGTGAADRPKGVRWGKAGEIVFTWVVTIPGTALVGALCQYLTHLSL